MEDVAIEIYPKLDAALLQADESQALSSSASVDSLMHNLLWMLDVADHRDFAETATAHLEEMFTSFFDLFAYLLGKNLALEMERGVPHSYVTLEDDLKAVRGRVVLLEQVSRNWNRFDRVSCSWDEFTPDIALNRLFKCACRFLSERVRHPEAARMLLKCEVMLTEVQDVSPTIALQGVSTLRFDRSLERFKTTFDLARRLLEGMGHNLGFGSTKTFVFLLDMNEVFEGYVHAVIEAHFKTIVEEQKYIGRLLRLSVGGIWQYADYFWKEGSASWIGDAKYKHLAKGGRAALRFTDLGEEQKADEDAPVLAGRILSSNDVRQLTVYAELARDADQSSTSPNLMLLYPFVGELNECLPDLCETWNGSSFCLVPVYVKPLTSVGQAIRLPGNMSDSVVANPNRISHPT